MHRGAEDQSFRQFFNNRTNSIAWHSDVTYEQQPPGTTILYALDVPDAGGDTLFCNMAKAYERLSPAFRERLEGLRAVHSGYEQAIAAEQKSSFVRRAPTSSASRVKIRFTETANILMQIHPIVRTHPATGEKALYVNPQFTRYIVGFKQEESDYLLKFLYDHIALSQDLQCRMRWKKGTVIVWDNRVTTHSALIDWENGSRRRK